LEDDFYIFEADRGQLIGRRTRRVIRLGDKVQVQVAKVDSYKKQVDFRLVKELGGLAPRPSVTRDSKWKGGASPSARTVPAGRPPQSKPQWNRESRPKQKFKSEKFSGNRRRPKR